MKKAVFLDRDGVLNELVLNPATGEYEPPHTPEELILFPGVLESLCLLDKSGFALFLVSNQPDFAKGKTMLENLQAVHEKLDGALQSAGILFLKYYYCFHHPKGVVPEYTFDCACRKPKPYCLLEAAKDYGIDLTNSWMIGDRDSDILCGKSAGVRTILIENIHSSTYHGSSNPDFAVANLQIAVQIIVQ